MSLPLSPKVQAGVEFAWAQLGEAGTSLTGAQRSALVTAARHGGGDRRSTAAHRIATAAADLVEADVAALGPQEWVEVVAVVSRIAAIDTTLVGAGMPLLAPPDPQPGTPSQVYETRASRRGAWVPTKGKPGATTAVSLVPAAAAAQRSLAAALYLDYPEMADQAAVRAGLTRPQMELVAARTSLLNDCFY